MIAFHGLFPWHWPDSRTEVKGQVFVFAQPQPGTIEMDIQPKPASLSKIEARDWYNAQVAKIDAVEQTMRQAGKTQQEIFEVTTEMRNQAKQLARDLMKDRRAAARLDKESPIKPKEEYLEKYGGDYEKAIEASKRANAQVNKRIEELRKERESKTHERHF